MPREESLEQWKWQDSLYDHYKDSFGHIRERELRRDREFLIVIALLGLLSIAIAYTSALNRALAGATLIGIKVDLSSVPAPAVLSAIWVFTLTLSMRYCQNCINIERQYSYLHNVESQLGKLSGNVHYFSREGRAYLDHYPRFSDWTWIMYIYVFPTIVVVASILLAVFEWLSVANSSLAFRVVDSLLATSVAATFFFYRLATPIGSLLVRAWRKSRDSDDSSTEVS